MTALIRAATAGTLLLAAALGSPTQAEARAPAPTVVSGLVTYQDKAGATHPSRRVFIELRDADGSPEGSVVDSGFASATGSYRLSASTKRPDGQARRLFVRASTRGLGYHVYNPATTKVYTIGSSPATATGTAQTVNLAPKGVNSDHNGAFAIADSLTSGAAFARSVAWGKVPDVRVLYPDPVTNYRKGQIRLMRADRFDWDVILHEFGHHLAQKLGASPSVGGEHSLFTNLSIEHGKTKGINLAWSEGVATWLAITAQQQQNVASLGIPRAGDTRYDDPEKNYSADLAGSAGGASVGEDDESAVARTLWQLENSPAFGMGRTAMLTELSASKPTTLSIALPHLMTRAGARPFNAGTATDPAAAVKGNDIACAIDVFGYSPKLTTPLQDAVIYSDPPTLTWTAGGAGPGHPLDIFTAEVWDENFTTLLYTSAPIAATTWTPSDAQWKRIREATDASGAVPERVQLVISGSGAGPVTGPYNGCARRQLRPQVDVVPAASDGILRPPAFGACVQVENAGRLSGSPSLTVTGSRLRPVTDYEVVLHREGADHADVMAFSATTNAAGDIASVTKDIPSMPGGEWQIRLRERNDPAEYLSVDGTADVWSILCWVYSSGPDLVNIESWGGIGARPGSSASIDWWGNGTHSANADADGNFRGEPHQTTCNRQGAVTGHFVWENLDGPIDLYRSAFCSARGGPGRALSDSPVLLAARVAPRGGAGAERMRV